MSIVQAPGLGQVSATCGSLKPQLWLLLQVSKDFFLGIIFGIIEVFGPDGSFAAPAGFRIATSGLIWLFKCKRFPTPGLGYNRALVFTRGSSER